MTEPKITPLARRLAEENGIDWHSLEGTGPDGTIVERDILAFLAKVMAGEVELPPEPADMAPPEAVPDISQVQEVLAREGVDIGELVPEAASETPAGYEPTATAEEVFVEEETFFEMDFDEIEAAPAEEVEAAGAAEEAAVESSVEEGWTVVEPETEEAAASSWLEEASEAEEAAPEEAPRPEEEPELSWEEALESASEAEEEAAFEWEAPEAVAEAPEAASEAVEAAAEAETFEELDFSEGAEETEPAPVGFEPEEVEEAGATEAPEPVEEESAPEVPETATEEAATEAALAAEEPGEETADEVFLDGVDEAVEEVSTETEETAFAELAPEPQPVTASAEPEGAPVEEAPAPEQAAGEPAVAAAPAVVFPPAFRRAVSLAAAEQARADLATAWRREVPLELLLFRAVDRALAELEVPMRPVLGRFEGEQARALAVQPALGLRDLYENLTAAEEEGEGLVVLDLGETPYAEVILPDKVLITLGRAGLPENLGLLSISGELPTDRTRFLERVAFYLERPILLA